MVQIVFPLQSAFLALPLEGTAKESFQHVQELLDPFSDLFRFQPADRPHLTLHFFRSLMEIEWGQVRKRAEWMAARIAPFTLLVTGCDTFAGPGGLERVIFLTVERSEPLATLRKLCPWPAGKPFHPHITIARMTNPNAYRVHRKRILKLVDDVHFLLPVDRLRLYGMVAGEKQTPIEDFVLSGKRSD